MELLTHHMGQGMFLILLLSMPAILVAAGVGLIVGILQAVTQVQEQTISTAPKIILVFALLIFGGGIMMTMLENYIRESANIAFHEVPNQEKTLLPPMATEERMARVQGFFGNDAKHFKTSRPQLKAPGVNTKDLSSEGVAAVGVAVNERYEPSITERFHLNKKQR